MIILYIRVKRKEGKDINYIKNKKIVNRIKKILKDRDNIRYVIVGMCVVVTLVVMLVMNVVHNKERKLVINGIKILKVFEKDKIGVYIDGEVNSPGFVRIPKGKNLEYALNKVQGITKDADIDTINLKQILKNGEKILIPSKKMDINESEEEQIGDKQIESEKININTASIEELKTLNGIGDKTAEKIIEYRKSNKFDNIEEIMEVKGIGESKYEKIKSDICI